MSARFNVKARNLLHTFFLLLSLAGLFAVIGYTLLGWQGLLWMTGLGLVLVVWSPALPSEWILRWQRATPLDPVRAPGLYVLINELLLKAGVRARPRVYLLPTQEYTAFTLGQEDDLALAASQGLLGLLNERELQGVLAHEIGHIKNKDIRLRTFASRISQITKIMALFGQVLVFINIPLILLGWVNVPWVVLVLLMVAPVLSTLVELGLSRTREFEADRLGVEITHDPKGLASALLKIDYRNKAIFSRLLFPYHHQPTWLSTHPDTGARVARLMAYQGPLKANEEYAEFREQPSHYSWSR